MSDSVSTSDTSDTSGDDEVIMFKCKKCADDKLFKASEKDKHRLWHDTQNQSRKGRSQQLPTPSGSQATSMFEQADSPAKRKKKPTPKKRKVRPKTLYNKDSAHYSKYELACGGGYIPKTKTRKIRSKKKYNTDHEAAIKELSAMGLIKGV